MNAPNIEVRRVTALEATCECGHEFEPARMRHLATRMETHLVIVHSMPLRQAEEAVVRMIDGAP